MTARQGEVFSVDAIGETASRSTLGNWKTGRRSIWERGMPADGRFDGHLVQGHVDGTAVLTDRQTKGNSVLLHFVAGEHLTELIVEKGSVTVDGVSLTVTDAEKGPFYGRTDSLIPLNIRPWEASRWPTG
ncbi:MAG: riboflavin synthase [Candidatus Marinimicrobia bacterium]|nr:riboflavin synthase [Candidatus Neomarinimicrobiota bacterium]